MALPVEPAGRAVFDLVMSLRDGWPGFPAAEAVARRLGWPAP